MLADYKLATLLSFKSPNELLLKGVLDTNSITQLESEGKKLMESLTDVIINLESVDHCTSAGLTLFTEWLRFCRQNNKLIRFANPPKQMQTIARVNGIVGLING